MRKKITDIVKKTAAVLGLVAFLATGYLSMSVMTSCKASAQCSCSGSCIMFGSIVSAFATVEGTTLGNIASVVTMYTMNATRIYNGVNDDLKAQIDLAKNDVIAAIDTLWYYNILPAMQKMTRQINTRDADQMRQLAQFQDAMNANRKALKVMEKQLETHREQRPSEAACVAATTTGGMSKATALLRAYVVAAAGEKLPRSANSILSKSFSSIDGDQLADRNNLIRPAYAATASPAALGAGADMADRWQHYKTNYCDHRANAKNAGCTSSSPYRNMDLDVAGQIFNKSTIDVTVTGPNGQKLNKMFTDDIITNLGEPFIMNNVPPRVVNSVMGEAEILQRQSYKAQRQAVYDLLYNSVARRMPSGNGGTSAAFFGELRKAAGVDTVRISDNPSYNEVVQVMMSERFHTGSLAVDQIDEPENNAREMVIQQAMQAMQLNDQLDLLDRYAFILAAQTGNDISSTRPVATDSANSSVQSTGGGP